MAVTTISLIRMQVRLRCIGAVHRQSSFLRSGGKWKSRRKSMLGDGGYRIFGRFMNRDKSIYTTKEPLRGFSPVLVRCFTSTFLFNLYPPGPHPKPHSF